MGRCKDCHYWEGHIDVLGREWHTCERVDWVDRDTPPGKDEAAIYAEASDDYGLMAGLLTGPEFGCTNFKRK